ncbi:Plasmodium exported protein (PHISTa), unknown, putative [Plasmodium sp. gorilla clade G1]|nr:Plasmodium exported protein (PHISTa), unknown, putative [Plasmodium sp. gorilla clade G1]
MNKKKGGLFRLYGADENPKGKLHYISFKFLCLCIYMIGFYYVFLNTSLENKSSGIVKISNIYERNLGESVKNSKCSKMKRILKHKKDVNQTEFNETNIKSNEQKVEKNKHSTKYNLENPNVENKGISSINNINYNDISNTLTEKELFDVLNSLEECPSKDDLRNIWTHTLAVAKEGFDDIQKELKRSIQKYLDNDIYKGTDKSYEKYLLYDTIWNETVSVFYRRIGTQELEYTNGFFRLINDKHTLYDILKFINSFLEDFKIFKNELKEEYQKELLRRIEKPWIGEN